MIKHSYRLLSPGLYDIGGYECFFSDVARKGLMVEDVGTFLIKFKKGAPQNKKYRIEAALPCVITPDKTYYDALPPEQIALYAESGWDLITYSDGFYIFAAEDDDSAPELHTDPELQAETLAALDKSLRKAAIVQLLRLPIFPILYMGSQSVCLRLLVAIVRFAHSHTAPCPVLFYLQPAALTEAGYSHEPPQGLQISALPRCGLLYCHHPATSAPVHL